MPQPPPAPPQLARLPALGPNDISSIFECLQRSLSNTAADQKAGEEALKQHDSREGFCSCLAEIVGTKTADYSAKWHAAVQLKNCVVKYWRKRLNAACISEEEKMHLRAKLLDLMPEEDSQIALQLAITFARIARLDYPGQWPTLVSDVMGRAAAGSLAARRAYLVLHHVLKELASKRLAADQRNFAKVTEQIYESVWTQWVADTHSLIERLPTALSAQSPPEQDMLTFERWLILLKALRRLVVFGFESDTKSLRQVPVVSQVLPAVQSALAALLPLRQNGTRPPSKLHAMLDRGLLKLAKVSTDVLEAHPWSTFHSGALQSFTEFYCNHIVAAAQQPVPFKRLLIRAMLFLRASLTASTFRKPTSAVFRLVNGESQQDASVEAMQAEVQRVLGAFWDDARLEIIVRTLVLHFFPLTAQDLADWRDSPEQFHHESDVGSWQDNLRVCSEALLLVLLERSRPAVAPVVLAVAQAACDAAPPGSTAQLAASGAPATGGIPAAVLTKEAALAAMGVGAYELHDFVDFSPWFASTLLPALADTADTATPLRRRAALVVARWVGKMGEGDRPPAYDALLTLLDSGDAALQLAAISALQALIDDWGFAEAAFVGVAGRAFHLLASFLRSASELDSQLQAFNLFSIIIDRLQADVAPFAPAILQLLPEVWADADGQPLMRSQVLMALQRLLVAAGPAGSAPAPEAFLLPALRYACDPAGPEALNLLEDGLATWLTALRCAAAPDPRLTDLFPLLVSVMHHSTEHVRAASHIIASCLLMGGAGFLHTHGAALGEALQNTYAGVGERGALALLPVAELILTGWPAEGSQLLQPLLVRMLATVLEGSEPVLVITGCLAVFARLLLHNRDAFLHLFSAAAATQQFASVAPAAGSPDPAQALLLAMIDVWLDRVDAIGAPAARKLSAAAMAAAFTLPVAPLLQRLDLMVSHVTSVCYEMEGDGDDERYRYSVMAARRGGASGGDASGGAVVPSEEAEGESQRWLQLYDADPVNHVKLSEALRAQLAAGTAAHGPPFTAALQALDPALQAQLKPIIS